MEDNVVNFDQKEYEKAQELAKKNTSPTRTLKLKKPFAWEGKEYTELHFDFDKLNGEDSLNVEDELQAKGITLILPTFNGHYLLGIASRACAEHLGSDAFKKMYILDADGVRSITRNFMLSSEQ